MLVPFICLFVVYIMCFVCEYLRFFSARHSMMVVDVCQGVAHVHKNGFVYPDIVSNKSPTTVAPPSFLTLAQRTVTPPSSVGLLRVL